MAILPRRGVLAITAVIDIALNARGRPVSAKALANRHGLPPRHLEPVLQALVRSRILKGTRGPGGGYELARPAGDISAEAILRSAGADEDHFGDFTSDLLSKVVVPALAGAEKTFLEALRRISVDDIAGKAEPADAAE
jgi:Rrf2 family transcriptional regulator, iron-sulfur cluster assembly transcription factor